MSIAELAAKSRLSSRAVVNATDALERLGEVKVDAKMGRGGRNGYRLCSASYARSYAESAYADELHMQNLPTPYAESAYVDDRAMQNLHRDERGQTGNPQVIAYAESAYVDNSSDMFVVPTGTSLVEVKDVPANPAPPPDRPDVDRLCEHLAARIVANGSKRPTITQKWRDAARLLIDKDGRTEQQVMTAIDWCQDSEFWRANILSMPKLREKYDQLRQQARRQPKQQNGNDNLGIVGRYLNRIGEDE